MRGKKQLHNGEKEKKRKQDGVLICVCRTPRVTRECWLSGNVIGVLLNNREKLGGGWLGCEHTNSNNTQCSQSTEKSVHKIEEQTWHSLDNLENDVDPECAIWGWNNLRLLVLHLLCIVL